jgi:hypothetical protein
MPFLQTTPPSNSCLRFGYSKLAVARLTIHQALPAEGLVLVYRRIRKPNWNAVPKQVFSATTPYLIGHGLNLEHIKIDVGL